MSQNFIKIKFSGFDFDGVIADSFEDSVRRILPVFKQLGYDISKEKFREMFKDNIVVETEKLISKELMPKFIKETFVSYNLHKILFPPKN